ncbi:MAG: class I SAM-dependent methyltransferase [Chlamydiota bacterium]
MGLSSYSNGIYVDRIYQDLWIKGAAMQVGGRGCKERYEAIAGHFSTLQGPLKVLDIGANMGYFSFRLAERFPGHFVMIESSNSTTKRLLQLCLMNANPQISFLATRVNLAELEKILIAEQFDIILALSVIHHFDEPFNDIVKTFARHAKHVILEHASPEETHCPNPARIKAEPLNLTPYNPIKLCTSTATGYQHIFRDVYALKGSIEESRTAPPGLSLQTYAQHSGLYPHPTLLNPLLKKHQNKELLRIVNGEIRK